MAVLGKRPDRCCYDPRALPNARGALLRAKPGAIPDTPETSQGPKVKPRDWAVAQTQSV